MNLTVDELANRLLVRVAVCDKRLNDLQHLHGSLGEPDEDAIVDLKQTQKLQCLALLRIDLVDTLYPDDEGELGLGGDVEAVALLGLTRQAHALPLIVTVFLHILLSTCEDDLALLCALVCLMLALSTSIVHAMSSQEGDCIIPERWLTIRQH
jgi:hypothetical protein